jgi:hypothetical protein
MTPDCGLHLIDVNIAMRSLANLPAKEAAAFAAQH